MNKSEIELIEKIREEVNKLTTYYTTQQGSELITREAVNRVLNLFEYGTRDGKELTNHEEK